MVLTTTARAKTRRRLKRMRMATVNGPPPVMLVSTEVLPFEVTVPRWRAAGELTTAGWLTAVRVGAVAAVKPARRTFRPQSGSVAMAAGVRKGGHTPGNQSKEGGGEAEMEMKVEVTEEAAGMV